MEGLGPLREVRSWEALEERDSETEVYEAVLLTIGEKGYEAATVPEICARAQISADRFYRLFGGKEGGFAVAYADAADRLRRDLLQACRDAATWRDGLRAGLSELLRFVAEQPLLAKALLLEVKAARGSAWVKHQEVVEQLTAALDTARAEPAARPAASLATAGFMAGAIEESLCIEIGAGRAGEVQRLLPDLMHLAILQFFGEDAAWDELGAPESGPDEDPV